MPELISYDKSGISTADKEALPKDPIVSTLYRKSNNWL